mmetsp:Transcript_31693/g.32290  ORF Transcript_31693/g.32290 Transcript_31693/m.32290 type:complete len:392 (+) Transcript_31693:95-1270(+)
MNIQAYGVIALLLVSTIIIQGSLFSTILRHSNYDRRKSSRLFKYTTLIRGGSTISTDAEIEYVPSGEPCTVIVSSTIGSSFLDKKKKLILPNNSTISELKTQLSKKFPGGPPVSIQRLIFGMRILNDNDILGNLTSISPIPILLDNISGTSAYNKTMTVSQALEAYTSLLVQQAYLGDQLQQFFTYTSPESSENTHHILSSLGDTHTDTLSPSNIHTLTYRTMFQILNTTLYSTYEEDIHDAFEREKEPEVYTSDTLAWRTESKKNGNNALAVALAKEFDLNMRGLIGFMYYSCLLGIFAYFGTTTQLSSQFLLFMVPVLWISKVRQLRLLSKLATYLILPVIPHLSFLMPLLPAPYQVIAQQASSWSEDEEREKEKIKKKKLKEIVLYFH